MKRAIFILVISLLIISFYIQADEGKSVQAKELYTIENAMEPFLSSDGSMIAWQDTQSDIYVAKVGSKERTQFGKIKGLLGWLPGSNEFLVVLEKGFLSIKTKQFVDSVSRDINFVFPGIIHGPHPKVRITTPAEIPSKILSSIPVIQSGKLLIAYSTGDPYNFSLFIDKDKQERKIILFSDGRPVFEKKNVHYVYSFKPSPSGDKIILEIDSNEEPGIENIVIDGETAKKYNLRGNISYGAYPNIISGGHSHFRWSPDGKKIIFTLLKDDGHKELSGDLFLCNWDGTDIREIKFETTRIRRNPSFGPSNMIIYRYDEKDKPPCIGVSKLMFSAE